MSTNGLSNWAVDLANISAVYPFQGFEFLMFVACVVFWLWWHWMQFRAEAREIQYETDDHVKKDAIVKAIDRY